jgi:AAA15 family ATPase/GTPase
LGEEQIVRKLSTIIRRDESQKEDLIKLIQLFDENILDFQVLLGQYQAKLYLKHRVLGLTPLYIFGDGIKRVLGIAMNVLTLRNGGVLLIDEIETSIHKSILGDAFRWLLKLCTVNKIQLFITTHSLEAVDAILGASDSVDDLAAFRLKSQQESPQRFTGDLLQRLRFDRGLDMR